VPGAPPGKVHDQEVGELVERSAKSTLEPSHIVSGVPEKSAIGGWARMSEPLIKQITLITLINFFMVEIVILLNCYIAKDYLI